MFTNIIKTVDSMGKGSSFSFDEPPSLFNAVLLWLHYHVHQLKLFLDVLNSYLDIVFSTPKYLSVELKTQENGQCHEVEIIQW